ncbi:hypothetical protein KASHIRA_01480 [Serratia phage vB_SmaM-Kashira]|nr:hypothetical protein KASHIRA_01480 [Serratia phage vB_SmaM-Kashira]
MQDEFDGFIGYGEGILGEEDWGVFKKSEENWDV